MRQFPAYEYHADYKLSYDRGQRLTIFDVYEKCNKISHTYYT